MPNDTKICLSVIVPVFNAEATLSRCVESILSQTIKNFELILVDDGSSDSSAELCDSFTHDDRAAVRVIHKENGGPCTARNCGIDNARGEFIGFVDADDWCDPHMFEELYSSATESGADMAICDYAADADADADGDENSDTESKNGRRIKSVLDKNRIYDKAQINCSILPYFFGYGDHELNSYKSFCPFADYSSYVWLCIYRTSMVRSNNLSFPSQSIYYNEDNLFNLDAVFDSSRIAHVAKYLYHYRDCESSLTKRYNPNFLKAKLNKFEYLKSFISKSGFDESFYHRLNNKICIESINIINYYINTSGAGLAEKYSKIREILDAPAISSALDELDLSQIKPISKLGIFLRLEKFRFCRILVLLCEGYRLVRR